MRGDLYRTPVIRVAGAEMGWILGAGVPGGRRMLTLDLDRFMFELKDGAVKHVGASNKTGTAKLYDVEAVEVRGFGDERVKLVFEDEDGNEVEVALFHEEAKELARGLEPLEADGDLG
jgi:hypothetical protein